MKKHRDYSDNELLMLMSQNDAEAFTALYNKHWKLLFSVACKKLSSSADAEEVIQDIFLDLWNRRHSLRIGTALLSYLSVSVNYRVFKILARRQLHARCSDLEFLKEEPVCRTETLLELEEVQERLSQLVSELPQKCRMVFRMSREESMTGKQIARELSIAEKTVESHITKALHYLKTGFGSLLILLLLN